MLIEKFLGMLQLWHMLKSKAIQYGTMMEMNDKWNYIVNKGNNFSIWNVTVDSHASFHLSEKRRTISSFIYYDDDDDEFQSQLPIQMYCALQMSLVS